MLTRSIMASMARDIKMTLSFLCLGHSSGTFTLFIFPAFSYVFSLCFLIVYLGILDFRKAPLPPKFFLFGKIEKAVPEHIFTDVIWYILSSRVSPPQSKLSVAFKFYVSQETVLFCFICISQR